MLVILTTEEAETGESQGPASLRNLGRVTLNKKIERAVDVG